MQWLFVRKCLLTNNCVDGQVKKVNGLEIDNLKHLCGLVEDCSSESLRFDLDDDSVIALNYQSAKVAISRILKRHRITVRMATSFLFHRQSARRTQAD
jgi:hypothetical protein